jgi:hypothetical protein
LPASLHQSHLNLISISSQSHLNLISISSQSHLNLISISSQSQSHHIFIYMSTPETATLVALHSANRKHIVCLHTHVQDECFCDLTPLRLRACIEKQATEVCSGYTRHQTKVKLERTSKRPIIFVVHNLGGIIVKAELVL